MKETIIVDLFVVNEIFRKMIRDYQELKFIINNHDIIFNFFITALHLSDYVVNQTEQERSNIIKSLEKYDNGETWKILSYLGNGFKHKRLSNSSHINTVNDGYELITKSLDLDGSFSFDGSRILSGKKYYIKIKNKEIPIVEFARNVINMWKTFFLESETSFDFDHKEIQITD